MTQSEAGHVLVGPPVANKALGVAGKPQTPASPQARNSSPDLAVPEAAPKAPMGPQQLAEERESVMQHSKKILELEHKIPPTLAAKKPDNFDSLGIRDSRTNRPISWERLNRALATKPDEAHFWSGRVNKYGVENPAKQFANEQGAVTLEKLLDRQGIKMPEWSVAPDAWAVVSRVYAENASGTARVFLGNDVRPRSVWETIERPTLTANPSVTRIIEVNALGKTERVLFERSKPSR